MNNLQLLAVWLFRIRTAEFCEKERGLAEAQVRAEVEALKASKDYWVRRSQEFEKLNVEFSEVLFELRQDRFKAHDDKASVDFRRLPAVSIERQWCPKRNAPMTIVSYLDGQGQVCDLEFYVSDSKHAAMVAEFDARKGIQSV